MTRALVTIEVDIDTSHVNTHRGLGESSNPNHPRIRWIQEESRGWIWDYMHSWLFGEPTFKKIVKVSLIKEGK